MPYSSCIAFPWKAAMKFNMLKARGAQDSRANDFLYFHDDRPGSRSLIAINAAVLKLATCMLLGAVLLFHNAAFADKCLYVSSYHYGYEWNDGIERGIETALGGKCELDKYYMDTKRNKDKAFYKQSALAAKKHIEETKPDIIIACDDNASKYLVMPYYKDADLPIVFCGINWSVKQYAYPYSNVTGIIEISPIKPMMKIVTTALKGVTHGVYLGPDVISQQKEFELNRGVYDKAGIKIEPLFVKTMAEWESAYIKAQQAEFIIIGNNGGINDWDDKRALEIVLSQTARLTVTNYDWMSKYAMLAMTKLAEEQGEWAAQVALTILEGEQPSNIPIVTNRRWNIFVNPTLLDKSAIKLPPHIMQKAIKIGL